MADLNENKPGLSAEASAKAGYKKTKVGWIPEEWEVKKLRKLIKSLESGVSVNGEERKLKSSEIAVLKVSAVSYGVFNPNEYKVISESDRKRARTNPQKGKILVSRANTPELVAASAYLNQDYHQLFLPDKLWQTNFHEDADIESLYVYYFLQTHRSRNRLSNLATGSSSSMKNISKGAFLSLSIPLPPLSEQRQIANLLSTWDTAIDKLGQLIAKKQALKKGLMQQLLSGRVRFPEFVPPGGTKYKETKVGWVPEDWEVVGLQDVSKPVSRKNTAQDAEVVLTASAQYGLVDQISFFNKSVSGKDLSKYYLLKKGEFAYNRSYSTGYDFGAIKRLDDYEEGVLSTLYICFSVKDEDISNYLTYYFETRLIQRELFSIVQEGARNHGLLNVAKSDFYEVKILLPPKEEIRKIFSFLAEVDLEIIKLKQEKSGFESQRKGLMQQLLTGAVRVKL